MTPGLEVFSTMKDRFLRVSKSPPSSDNILTSSLEITSHEADGFSLILRVLTLAATFAEDLVLGQFGAGGSFMSMDNFPVA